MLVHFFDNLVLLNKDFQKYRRSLQPLKEKIQHFKNEIYYIFPFLWVIFALLDPIFYAYLNKPKFISNYCPNLEKIP